MGNKKTVTTSAAAATTETTTKAAPAPAVVAEPKLKGPRSALYFLDMLAPGQPVRAAVMDATLSILGDHFVTRRSTYMYDLEKYWGAKIERVHEGRNTVAYTLLNYDDSKIRALVSRRHSEKKDLAGIGVKIVTKVAMTVAEKPKTPVAPKAPKEAKVPAVPKKQAAAIKAKNIEKAAAPNPKKAAKPKTVITEAAPVIVDETMPISVTEAPAVELSTGTGGIEKAFDAIGPDDIGGFLS